MSSYFIRWLVFVAIITLAFGEYLPIIEIQARDFITTIKVIGYGPYGT